jgi:pimeloyl-ACP methyl ester carboxylesterase
MQSTASLGTNAKAPPAKYRWSRFVGGPRSRIACAVDGAGPLLVLPAWWVSHVERDLANPAFARFFARLATRFTVVRYDRPGVGLSDRERASFTLEDEVATLEAVLDDLAVPRVSLLAVSCGAPPALMLAARRPERLERLVVFGGYACGSSIAPPDSGAAGGPSAILASGPERP